MDELTQCPFCCERHPVATAYCPVMLTPLPRDAPDDSDRVPVPDPPVVLSGTCSNCGDAGSTGRACRQCGSPLTERPVGHRRASLYLPSGGRVALPTAKPVMLGRRSEIPEIRAALDPFDAVSRRHCSITVDGDRGVVTVRDEGSTNHTWVGDDELHEGDLLTVPLPVSIRFGRHLSVTVDWEGGTP